MALSNLPGIMPTGLPVGSGFSFGATPPISPDTTRLMMLLKYTQMTMDHLRDQCMTNAVEYLELLRQDEHKLECWATRRNYTVLDEIGAVRLSLTGLGPLPPLI